MSRNRSSGVVITEVDDDGNDLPSSVLPVAKRPLRSVVEEDDEAVFVPPVAESKRRPAHTSTSSTTPVAVKKRSTESSSTTAATLASLEAEIIAAVEGSEPQALSVARDALTKQAREENQAYQLKQKTAEADTGSGLGLSASPKAKAGKVVDSNFVRYQLSSSEQIFVTRKKQEELDGILAAELQRQEYERVKKRR